MTSTRSMRSLCSLVIIHIFINVIDVWNPSARDDFGLLSSCLALSDCESLSMINTTGFCTVDAYLRGPPIVNTSCLHTTAWGVDLDIGCKRHAGVSYTNFA